MAYGIFDGDDMGNYTKIIFMISALLLICGCMDGLGGLGGGKGEVKDKGGAKKVVPGKEKLSMGQLVVDHNLEVIYGSGIIGVERVDGFLYKGMTFKIEDNGGGFNIEEFISTLKAMNLPFDDQAELLRELYAAGKLRCEWVEKKGAPLDKEVKQGVTKRPMQSPGIFGLTVVQVEALLGKALRSGKSGFGNFRSYKITCDTSRVLYLLVYFGADGKAGRSEIKFAP